MRSSARSTISLPKKGDKNKIESHQHGLPQRWRIQRAPAAARSSKKCAQTDGVVSASIVVGGILLSGDQLLRVEELTIRSGADLIDHGGLQIDEHAAGHMLASTGLREELNDSRMKGQASRVRPVPSLRFDSTTSKARRKQSKKSRTAEEHRERAKREHQGRIKQCNAPIWMWVAFAELTGVESIIAATDGLVRRHLAIRLDAIKREKERRKGRQKRQNRAERRRRRAGRVAGCLLTHAPGSTAPSRRFRPGYQPVRCGLRSPRAC